MLVTNGIAKSQSSLINRISFRLIFPDHGLGLLSLTCGKRLRFHVGYVAMSSRMMQLMPEIMTRCALLCLSGTIVFWCLTV